MAFPAGREREALRRGSDLEGAAVTAGGLPGEDLANTRRIQPEVELRIMEAHVDIFAAFRVFIDIVIRYGKQFAPIDPKRLQRFGKGVLMRVIPDDQESQRFAERLIRAHFVNPRLLQDPGGFQHEVVQQVADQVPMAVHIVAVPRISGGIDRQGALSTHDEMMRVCMLYGFVERRRIYAGVPGIDSPAPFSS